VSEEKGKKPIKVNKNVLHDKQTVKTSGKKPIKTKKEKTKSIKPIIWIGIGLISILVIIFLLKLIFTPSIESVKDSVVLVEVYDDDYELIASGSGFSAYRDNWIVTNFHVIEGARHISIITDDGEKIEVDDVVVFNKKEDLAIVSIDGKLDNLKLGNGNKIKTKDKVTTIGSPMGEKNTVSEGIVSNSDEKNIIRITAPISHGSSGGVLLNKNNQVIGITSAGYDDAQNLNFAINVNVLNKMYSDYKNNKYDVIDSDNYKDCAPNIINYNTTNELKIKNKCSFSSYNNYSAENLEAFYLSTNSYEIFNTAMYKLGISGFNVNYKRLSKEEQKLASEYYTNLLEYEDCDTDAYVGCSIDNISNWNAEQLVMELDIMQTYALAIFLVEIEDYNYNTVFNYVNSLSLGIPEKGVLLLLYGGYEPSDLNNADAKNVINYINEFNLSISEKGKILEYLGYSVNGSNVNW